MTLKVYCADWPYEPPLQVKRYALMNYDFLHEAEEVYLVSESPRQCSIIHSIPEQLGYTLHENVYSLERPEPIPPWQSESFVLVDILSGASEVYQPWETWDTIKLVCLLATLPGDAITRFVASVSHVSCLLEIPMTHAGKVVTALKLEQALVDCADELRRNVGEPGTESVAIYIESTYPRSGYGEQRSATLELGNASRSERSCDMKTRGSEALSAWDGNWQERLSQRLRKLGFETFQDYLRARRGRPYGQLAAELSGDPDAAPIAPVQLERMHAWTVSQADRYDAILDSLVRYLTEYLRKGWGVGIHWQLNANIALAFWSSNWGDKDKDELRALEREIRGLNPEAGWIPKDADDAILQEAARRVWSRS